MDAARIGMIGNNQIHADYVIVETHYRDGSLKEKRSYLTGWRMPTEFELQTAH